MSEIALQRIEKEKKERTGYLDLSYCGLKKIPNELFELEWLIELFIEDKSFEKREFFNNISHIPFKIKKLKNLKKISIVGRPFNKNGLKNIQHIASLENLEYANFNNNSIEKLPNFARLNKLTVFYLYANRIIDLSPLNNSTQLIRLNLATNHIQDISPLSTLLNLKYLSLTENPIKDITPILPLIKKHLPEIQDSGYVHADEREFYNFHYKIEVPPYEIVMQGSAAIVHYLEQIRKKEKSPLNQLKTLLVGDGLSGKTSLLKQILKKEFDYSEPQTHGINIHPKYLEIAGESIHVKFWDFGGQEIMHGTHTFFYSKRSICLLVLDARREGKEDYWFKHIESFGGDSPVLVVLNKIDENPSFEVNRAFLQQKYPNIRGFLRVSCKTGEGISELVLELERQIHALEMRRTPFAKSWFEVKESLDTMGEDYISYERYYALCREKEVADETAQNVLLQFLHDLGIVLAFRNLELHDTQVINPLWLTNAVYRIINSRLVAKKKGYLYLSDLDAILNDPGYAHEGFKYPKNKFLYIVKIMQEFELCYRIAEDVFIVPDLLTVEEQPVSGFDYDTALRFVLQYDFLPASVLPRFMVQLHTRIVETEQWRTGTALEDPIFKSKAVVKADRDEKRIYLWVTGTEKDNRRSFFNFIRKTLQDIHDSFEKLTVTELVPVSGYDDIFIEYAELVGYEEMGLSDYPVGKLRRKFPVDDLLNGIEAPERRQLRRYDPVKVFVSYSHKDVDYKDELVTALAYLSRMEEIELWQDGRIEAGMEWRKEIFEKLAEAEIVICLVSSNFIASDFCYSIELKQALEAHDKGVKIVVPIEVKTCGWKQIPEFGRIQGVPAKPISSFVPHDDGWGEVFKGMEAAVKRIREKR